MNIYEFESGWRMGKSISIKHQLMSVLAVVVIGFLSIGLAYQAALKVDDSAFAEAQTLNEVGTLVDRIRMGMLEAQYAGSQFLLTNRLQAVEQNRQVIARVTQDMTRLSQQVTAETAQQLLQRMRQSVQNYQRGFERMVELKQTYGLDADSGQLGELHKAARAMEDVIKQYGGSAQELLTSMLIMRRNEKDYIAYRDEDSLSRMPSERMRFEMFLEGGLLLQEDKDAIAPRLNDYHDAFSRLVELIQRIAVENAALGKSMQELEPVLAELQEHKDQLLAQGQTRVQTERVQIGQAFIGVIVLVGLLASLLLLVVTRAVLRPLGGEPDAIATLVRQVAEGDLSVELSHTGRERSIYAAMRDMIDQLRDIVQQVSQTILQVSASAEQLVQESTGLSQRTEAQAQALEETAASMEQLTSTIANSAEHAAQAERLADEARTQAEQGGKVIQGAMTSMTMISTGSQRITAIIGVIDEIAFQTNLLALNAGVEAARAGEQGRGFAVVALEVRRLAQRSKDAAQEIKTLIANNAAQVTEGGQRVEQSSQVLQAIILKTRKVTEIVAEMAVATREQACGVEQVNQAIQQMDQVTQQNAQLAVDTATASRSMSGQALGLQRLMNFFKLATIRNGMFEDTDPEDVLAAPSPTLESSRAMLKRQASKGPLLAEQTLLKEKQIYRAPDVQRPVRYLDPTSALGAM
ncbi:MAG: hypothetical protein H6974_01125 [Gammaproteobacteria bacterium]|nr:hypothetical protein [Gammaproteobacteria bacterium]MCP5195389.1 hypothetical protein [Gammaproteobacteria bacterium]